MMLEIQNTQLIIIDIQGKLAQIVYEAENIINNTRILINAAKILNIPIIWVEQNPKGLGATCPEIAELLSENKAIPKMTFSAYGSEEFRNAVAKNNRKEVVVAGIETHICVYQTSLDLMQAGYELTLITDAVSSRTMENKLLGIEKLKDNGAKLSGTEMLIFELQKTCDSSTFKQILHLIKQHER